MKTKNFIKDIEEIKNKSELDLSLGEDLSIALMNLVSLEEHFLFSYMKTNEKKFLDYLEQTRELRKKLLSKIVKKDDDSEKWCISKHLLASSMRLSEAGTKELHAGNKKEAEEMFDESFELYSMFWGINNEKIGKLKLNGKTGGKISQLVNKMLDCCRE